MTIIGLKVTIRAICIQVNTKRVLHKEILLDNLGKRLPIQQTAIERVERYFINPNRALVNLRFVNGSSRRQREERREACCKVLQLLLYYTNISNLVVGTPDKDGGVHGLRLCFIARKLGWRTDNDAKEKNEKGLKRVYRAMQDLVRAGYIHTIGRPVRRKQDQSWCRLATIRGLTELVFEHLGFKLETLQKSQRYAKNKLYRAKAFQNNRKILNSMTPSTKYKQRSNSIRQQGRGHEIKQLLSDYKNKMGKYPTLEEVKAHFKDS